jgi:hypothetical protein
MPIENMTGVSWANRSCDEFAPFEPAGECASGAFTLAEEKHGEVVTEFFAVPKFGKPKGSEEPNEEEHEESGEEREYIAYVARMVSGQCGATIEAFQVPEASPSGCPVYRTPHAKRVLSGLHPTFTLRGTESQVRRGIELIRGQFSLAASRIRFRLPADNVDDGLIDRVDPGRKYDLTICEGYLDAMVTVHQADAVRLACSLEIHKLVMILLCNTL